jgi:hypothetical protein
MNPRLPREGAVGRRFPSLSAVSLDYFRPFFIIVTHPLFNSSLHYL